MGRYYDGDIQGKFVFGVQSSRDADFFGVDGSEITQLSYQFETENLPDVEAGIEKCLEELKILPEGGDREKWEARLDLGNQIKDCLIANGQCYFTAEY